VGFGGQGHDSVFQSALPAFSKKAFALAWLSHARLWKWLAFCVVFRSSSF